MSQNHDPGGKRLFPLKTGVRGGAVISPCGRYRTLLWREWGEPDSPVSAVWVGLNPSTATGNVDDPTIRREIDFTYRLGFRRYVKVNTMDYRSTDPKALRRAGVLPCSSGNLATIRREAAKAGIIVLSCGKLVRHLHPYLESVVDALREDGHPLWALGLNRDGSPKHSLYVPASAVLIRV
jgi:hypothetical protein